MYIHGLESRLIKLEQIVLLETEKKKLLDKYVYNVITENIKQLPYDLNDNISERLGKNYPYAKFKINFFDIEYIPYMFEVKNIIKDLHSKYQIIYDVNSYYKDLLQMHEYDLIINKVKSYSIDAIQSKLNKVFIMKWGNVLRIEDFIRILSDDRYYLKEVISVSKLNNILSTFGIKLENKNLLLDYNEINRIMYKLNIDSCTQKSILKNFNYELVKKSDNESLVCSKENTYLGSISLKNTWTSIDDLLFKNEVFKIFSTYSLVIKEYLDFINDNIKVILTKEQLNNILNEDD